MSQWHCRSDWFGETLHDSSVAHWDREPGMHRSPQPSPLRRGEGESRTVRELLDALQVVGFMGRGRKVDCHEEIWQ